MIQNLKHYIRCIACLAIMLVWGCTDPHQGYTDLGSVVDQLLQIETTINSRHIAYRSHQNKMVVRKSYTVPKNVFDLEDIYIELYSDLYHLDQSLIDYTPMVYDLSIDADSKEEITFTSTLYLGLTNSIEDLSSIDPCEPFSDDYYIGWEVSLIGPQEQNPYNSRCDGEDIGHSAFQKMSQYMALGFELQQPPINKGQFIFTQVDYFDLRFENNQFSEHDYKYLVENCIGRSVNDFRPDICVPDYDLNCIYCDLMPLIETEVSEHVLPANAEVAIFYFFFGYNSTGLNNNSIGYGLCYGVPEYIAPTDSDVSTERCFCTPVPDRPISRD